MMNFKKNLSKHTYRRYLIRINLILVMFIFGYFSDIYSQSSKGFGKYGASFLQISSSARQVGMGEAFTGLAEDVNFFQYNIGGLGAI